MKNINKFSKIGLPSDPHIMQLTPPPPLPLQPTTNCNCYPEHIPILLNRVLRSTQVYSVRWEYTAQDP